MKKLDVDQTAKMDELFKDHPDKKELFASYFSDILPADPPKPSEKDESFFDGLGNFLLGK